MIEATIVEKRRWHQDLYSLRFEADLQPFEAGQYVRIEMSVNGERMLRPYSLVNPPGLSVHEIYFNRVPDGPVTPRLCELEAGDRLQVDSKARGVLTLQSLPDSQNLWMFATGTGLGPFLSMLATDDPWSRYRSVVLVHSVRYAQDLSYRQRIDAVSVARGMQFTYLPVVTREQTGHALHERIPPLVSGGTLERLSATDLSPQASHALLCGNQAMIEDVSAVLAKRGMQRHTRARPGHVSAEKYH